MRKFILLIAVIFFFLNAGSTSFPAEKINPGFATNIESTYHFFNITTAKIKEVEKFLGRKMKLKEKIGFKILQHKLKKQSTHKNGEKDSDKGKTAMIFGIIAISCLVVPFLGFASIPLAILAIVFGNQAKKANPNDSKAKTGVILGWVTLGLVLLALVLVVAILATWSGWGWG